MQIRRLLAVRLGLSFLIAAGLMTWPLSRSIAEPYTLSADFKNRVEFQSKATLESFNGKAKGITAEFEVDPANLSRSRGTVTVDLRSLDTGIEMRNKHMRNNHLQTDSFPNAVFALDSVSGSHSMTPSGPTSITVHGTMTIHGVSRLLSAPATLLPVAGKAEGAVRLQTEFPLKMTDYGIPRPEFLFLKLAEEVKIVVDLTVVPQSE